MHRSSVSGSGSAYSRSAVKAGLQFPVGRIDRLLRSGHFAARIGAGAPVYLAAVLEYLAAEILELAVRNFSAQARDGADFDFESGQRSSVRLGCKMCASTDARTATTRNTASAPGAPSISRGRLADFATDISCSPSGLVLVPSNSCLTASRTTMSSTDCLPTSTSMREVSSPT